MFWIPLKLIRLFIFWLLFFATGRLVFAAYYFSKFKGVSTLDFLSIFYHAIKLDTSAISYLLVIPLVLFIAAWFINSKLFLRINHLYTYLMILVVSIITAGEITLYAEWGTKLDYKAVIHLAHPSEVFATATPEHYFTTIFGWIIIGSIGFILFHFLFKRNESQPENFPVFKKILISISTFLITGFLLGMGIRGGLMAIPINQSDAYFSTNNILNLVAVNPSWNLVHSITENTRMYDHNPYEILPQKDAEALVKSHMQIQQDGRQSILTTTKPNVVVLIMESWSADLVEATGATIKGITPVVDGLAKDGFTFTNCYASGERSEQGMAAIFSAFPAQTVTSILTQPSKFQKLPCINTNLQKAGYYTSYYFGGQLSYGNIKSYILYNGFNKVMDGVDFPSSYPRGKLGIHDEFTSQYFADDIGKQKSPFFSCLFSVSTHAPFDMPIKKMKNICVDENPYLNSANYADSCIGLFFKKARKEKWYANTLFVIIADHAHPSYRKWNFNRPGSHKISMLFYGDVIKPEYRGKTFDKICSQTDFTATLLSQLNLDATDFEWSRDVLSANYKQPSAFYTFVEGMGWYTPQGHFLYEYRLKDFLEKEYANPEMEKREIQIGKSYNQVLFGRYLGY
ncbi:MAG: sulfatase-like hydrolase/transferase [Bacteroidetes bacterium]|nr:sulfatase-like hydrolase/transferase [Bacteroidota bacterium]